MSPEDHPTVRSLSITKGAKENQHGKFEHLDNYFLDCAADCDVRWLFAAATAQSWRRAYAVSGRLFPGRARARRRPAVVVAALLYLSGPNGPSRFGQAGGMRRAICGHPGAVGGIFPSHDARKTKTRIHRDNRHHCWGGAACLLRHSAGLWPDHNALKVYAIESAIRSASRVKRGDWQSATSS